MYSNIILVFSKAVWFDEDVCQSFPAFDPQQQHLYGTSNKVVQNTMYMPREGPGWKQEVLKAGPLR